MDPDNLLDSFVTQVVLFMEFFLVLQKQFLLVCEGLDHLFEVVEQLFTRRKNFCESGHLEKCHSLWLCDDAVCHKQVRSSVRSSLLSTECGAELLELS